MSKKGVSPIWIQYEFDAVYKLHEMWVWNSNQMVELDIGFGAKDVTMEYSLDGTNWTTWLACRSLPRQRPSPTTSTTPR